MMPQQNYPIAWDKAQPETSEPESPASTPPAPQAPEALTRSGRPLQTRPEENFKRRRLLMAAGLIMLILAVCTLLWQNLSDPGKGMREGFQSQAQASQTKSAQATQTSTARTPVPTQVVIVAPPIIAPTPTATRRTESVAATIGSLTCWANEDLPTSVGVYPRDSMLRVTGWTAARGGMVDVEGNWYLEKSVRCQGDVKMLERPFILVPSPTPTRVPVVRPAVVTAPTPMIVYVPAPTLVPQVVNGIVVEPNGCISVTIYNVAEIWIDGKGVSAGTYCSVKEFRVIVSK